LRALNLHYRLSKAWLPTGRVASIVVVLGVDVGEPLGPDGTRIKKKLTVKGGGEEAQTKKTGKGN